MAVTWQAKYSVTKIRDVMVVTDGFHPACYWRKDTEPPLNIPSVKKKSQKSRYCGYYLLIVIKNNKKQF